MLIFTCCRLSIFTFDTLLNATHTLGCEALYTFTNAEQICENKIKLKIFGRNIIQNAPSSNPLGDVEFTRKKDKVW